MAWRIEIENLITDVMLVEKKRSYSYVRIGHRATRQCVHLVRRWWVRWISSKLDGDDR